MIIFRYITKEVLLTTLAILLVFLVIFLSTQLAMFLSQMATGYLDSSLTGKIMGILVITLLSLLLPMAFFVGSTKVWSFSVGQRLDIDVV